MRIAHLTWSMGIGGIQTMLVEIANIQVKEGNEVGIFVIDTYVNDTILKQLDGRVKLFFMGRTRGKKAILPFVKLNWKLWNYHPDIIHSHAGKLIKVVFTPFPAVVTVHNMKTKPQNYTKYLAKYAISNAVKDEWKDYGYEMTEVIDNGILCNAIKKKHSYNNSGIIRIVVLSRIFFHQKRQDLVIMAMQKLQETAVNQGREILPYIVHFVGDGVDMDKLKDMVIQRGLSDKVVFEGFKSREWVYEHLRDFDLFVQPSDYEGFGLTVAEACAAKLPVLVSDIDGPLEIIDGGRLGLSFKHSDVDDFADKLQTFLTGKYDYSLIEKAYQHVIKNYDVSITAHKYLDEYKKVLGYAK